MYQSHWRLNGRPFDHGDDGAFYYPAEGHQAALGKLRYALEHGCGAALAGASGVGKSLLLRMLKRQLADRGFVFVRVAWPRLAPGELLGYLADELDQDVPPARRELPPLDQCLRRLEAHLVRLASQEKRVVVAVDEAHAINNPDTFEALRLLLSLTGEEQEAPALLVVGQTHLLTMLSRLADLEERLAATCLVPAFCAEETAAYITHRLGAAGRTDELFDASACEAVYALTHGIPRRINRLCDLALLVGYAEERHVITAEHIEAVGDDLVPTLCVKTALPPLRDAANR
jgi:general secretion pathway protein A